MSLKMISVITPSLNSGPYLEHAIRSVYDQGYPNFEHIIVDGGSADETITILHKYPHVKWISEPDKGQSDAMNKGLELSRGEIIVNLNADDYFQPKTFQTVARSMSDDICRFVVGQIKVLKPDGEEFLNDPKVELADMLRWWQENAYCYNSAGYFYHREIQELVGPFNVADHLAMDYEFLIKARRITPFKKINQVFACFRLFPGTKTHANIANEQATFARFDEFFRYVSDSKRQELLQEKRAFFG